MRAPTTDTQIGTHGGSSWYAYLNPPSSLTGSELRAAGEAFVKSCVIHDTSKAVFWTGTEFEAIPVRIHGTTNARIEPYDTVRRTWANREIVMTLYYPIDPRIDEIDVAGALKAYPNETNTGWLFAHTDEGTHHDYELSLLAATDGVVQPLFRAYMVDSFSADAEAAARGRNRYAKLAQFYGDVLVEAKRRARSIYLGEREQKAHPREGWLDRDITASVAVVKAKWTETKPSDLAVIASGVRYIETALTMPAAETRWAQEARLQAEKDSESEDE